MSQREHERISSSDVTYPRSPEEFSAGAILTGALAAVLVIGIVVYSIINMNEVQRATVNPLPPKLSLETTGQGAPVPILPGISPQSPPVREVPAR